MTIKTAVKLLQSDNKDDHKIVWEVARKDKKLLKNLCYLYWLSGATLTNGFWDPMSDEVERILPKNRGTLKRYRVKMANE